MKEKLLRDILSEIKELEEIDEKDPFLFDDMMFLSQHSFPQAMKIGGKVFLGGSGTFKQKVAQYDMHTGEMYEVDLEYAPGDDHNTVALGLTNNGNNLIVT